MTINLDFLNKINEKNKYLIDYANLQSSILESSITFDILSNSLCNVGSPLEAKVIALHEFSFTCSTTSLNKLISINPVAQNSPETNSKVSPGKKGKITKPVSAKIIKKRKKYR